MNTNTNTTTPVVGTSQSWAYATINNAGEPSAMGYMYQFVAGNDRYMGDIQFGSLTGDFEWSAGKLIPTEDQLALTTATGSVATFGSGASNFYDVGGANDDESFDITVAGGSTGVLMNSSTADVKVAPAVAAGQQIDWSGVKSIAQVCTDDVDNVLTGVAADGGVFQGTNATAANVACTTPFSFVIGAQDDA